MIDETKSRLFQKINNADQPLAKFLKKKRERPNKQNQKWKRSYNHYHRNTESALAGVAQWTECLLLNQMVTSSISTQGTCLGCRPGPIDTEIKLTVAKGEGAGE